MDINIISRDNGVGLTKDVSIITQLLKTDGHNITFSDFHRDKPSDKKFDLNLFVELVNPIWFNYANKNTIIPNPEWYDNHWRQHLNKFDIILCKTRTAEKTFLNLGLKTAFISFTSEDRLYDNINKNDRFFHLAGKSGQKGTETIIKTWERNPQFPTLTIIQDPGKWKRRVTVKNMNIICDKVEDITLKTMQNSHSFHLCPSETEGFGHYIMEALSSNAVVITTNAPPMNDIITQERGILTPYVKRAPQRLAINYYIAEQTLEMAINQAIIMTNEQKSKIRANGRSFFLENDIFFRKTFPEVIRKII